MRPTTRPVWGDAVVCRHIAKWRRITARLQVLVNICGGNTALADEAHALRRQCERLAAELGQLARQPLAHRNGVTGPGR